MKLCDRSINNKNAISFSSVDSIDQGIGRDELQADLTDSDFSLPPVRRKSLIARKVSFSTNNNNKQSFESSDLHHTSSGYSSLFSSSSSSAGRSSHNRTPTKRKFEERDENVSPLKIRKKDPSNLNRAKRILKEKSSSENVLLSSTPLRGNSRSLLWGKSRSLHPHKFSSPQKSLEEVESFEKPPTLPASTEISFNVSGFDSTISFDQTCSLDTNIPPQFHQLMTSSMVGAIVQPKPVEKIIESQENAQPTSSTLSSSCQRRSYLECEKLDILGTLNSTNDLALGQIFSYLTDPDLLSLSHVSTNYRSMIKSNKTLEIRRLNYLKNDRENLENKRPGASFINVTKPKAKDRKKAFGEFNVNHSMQLRSTTPSSPPTSPSRKRLQDNHSVSYCFQYKLPTLKLNFLLDRADKSRRPKDEVSKLPDGDS